MKGIAAIIFYSGEFHDQRFDCTGGADRHRAGAVWTVRGSAQSTGGEGPGGEGGMVAGGYCAAAARGFDSKSGGDGEGLRAARSDRVWRHREGAVSAAFGADSVRQDCSERAVGWGDRAVAADCGELSATEVE